MKGYKELVAEANAVVTTVPVEEAAAQVGNEDKIFVDLRGDVELVNTGTIYV